MLFSVLNSLKSHPFYYLSPNTYAVGNCAEEIYCGLIKARVTGKKLIILYMFDLPFIFKYKLTNRSLFSIESNYIYNPNKYLLFLIRLILTGIYIPLRTVALVMRNFFDVRLDEAYSYPCIGRNELFVNNLVDSHFSFENVMQYDWKTKFGYEFDFTIGGQSKSDIFNNLEKMGLPKDAWYVCLHVRESGFRDDRGRREYRNANISNYIPAIKKIVSEGGWVVRLGDNTMTPLPKIQNVIDYPFYDFKSDLTDLCLIKHCNFYIGCQSGVFDVAKLLNKPTLLINMYNWTFGGPLHTKDRGILKHIFSKKNKSYLSIKELFSGGYETQNMNGEVTDYIFVENSKNEILEAVSEYMDCIVKNSFAASETQLTSQNYVRKQAYSIFENSRLAPKNVMSDHEELIERYRIASQVLGSSGFICSKYLEKNWESDSLNSTKERNL